MSVFVSENGRPKFTNTYLTPVYAKERNAHGVDGRDSPAQEENYDSIPITGVNSYNRSQAYSERPQTTDGSASSSDRYTSGGSGVSGRQDNRTAGNYQEMAGRDNIAFENDTVNDSGMLTGDGQSNLTSSSGRGSGAQSDSYIEPERKPQTHRFIKPSTTQVPPSQMVGVVYQADGSYITATADLDAQ